MAEQEVSNGVNGFHFESEQAAQHINGEVSETATNGHTSNGLRVTIQESASSSVNGGSSPTNGTITPIRKRMERKKSSPMMPTFMVSAPGKVIVFGEHAVVHGKVCCAVRA